MRVEALGAALSASGGLNIVRCLCGLGGILHELHGDIQKIRTCKATKDFVRNHYP